MGGLLTATGHSVNMKVRRAELSPSQDSLASQSFRHNHDNGGSFGHQSRVICDTTVCPGPVNKDAIEARYEMFVMFCDVVMLECDFSLQCRSDRMKQGVRKRNLTFLPDGIFLHVHVLIIC